MEVLGTDKETYDVPEPAYEAIVAEQDKKREKEVANVARGHKSYATRLENENKKLQTSVKEAVDELYAAWWNSSRPEFVQDAIRKLRALLDN